MATTTTQPRKAVPAKKTAAKKTAAKRATPVIRTATPADDAFKQNVVNVAMRYTRVHGWCDVVRQALVEAGLGEYMPSEYCVQTKQSRNDTWVDMWDYNRSRSGHRDLDVTKREYDSLVKAASKDAIERFAREQLEKFATNKTSAKDLHAKLDEALLIREQMDAGTITQYPIYRMVKRPQGSPRNFNGPVGIEVLEIQDEPPTKVAAKKVAAKKVAAKKTAARHTGTLIVTT